MSHWQGSVLTAAGRVLQAKVETGTTLELTRIKLGDGIEAMSAVDTLTDLVSPKAVLGISSTVVDGQDAIITGVMSASHLSAGFYCREWGLFARDPDVGEILYMVTIDDIPEWLPASTEAAQVSATYALNIAVANATNIEVNIDPAGLVDVDMLNEILGVAERSKVYSVGYLASMSGLPTEHYLRCITAGTTGANTPVLPANIKDGDKITDGTVMWQVTKAMSAAELGYRQPDTIYAVRQIAYHASLPTGYYLECTTPGTTSSGDLSIGSGVEGDTVIDGTVAWTIVNSALQSSSFGKSIVNHLLGSTLASLVDVVSTDSLFSKLLKKALEAAGLQYNIGSNGYICFGALFGGLILQWGEKVVQGGGYTDASFPVSFTTGYIATATSTEPVEYIKKVSNSTLRLIMGSLSSQYSAGVEWIAIGY